MKKKITWLLMTAFLFVGSTTAQEADEAAVGDLEVDVVEAGDLCALVGLEPIEIGDTIADPSCAEPLPLVHIDEPTLHMTFRVNDGPFSGRDGNFLTSRQISERLQRELRSNVALRVSPGTTQDRGR